MPSPKRRQTGVKTQPVGAGHGDPSSEDVAYERYVREQIERGLADIKAGRVISDEKIRQKFGIGGK